MLKYLINHRKGALYRPGPPWPTPNSALGYVFQNPRLSWIPLHGAIISNDNIYDMYFSYIRSFKTTLLLTRKRHDDDDED